MPTLLQAPIKACVSKESHDSVKLKNKTAVFCFWVSEVHKDPVKPLRIPPNSRLFLSSLGDYFPFYPLT